MAIKIESLFIINPSDGLDPSGPWKEEVYTKEEVECEFIEFNKTRKGHIQPLDSYFTELTYSWY